MEENNQDVQSTKDQDSTDKGKNTGMAIVAYLIFFVPLLTDSKNDLFVKFHVKQGIILFALGIINFIISFIIPFWAFVSPLISVASLVLIIIGIINAANGKQEYLPVIGKYAEKFLKF